METDGEKQQLDQRDDYRVSSKAAIFLELESSDPENNIPAKLLMCQLLDVSASGMRIRLDRELPVGSILNLCANFVKSGEQRHQANVFRVVGEVRWIKKMNAFYIAGFSLFESLQSDIAEWKLLVAKEI